VQLNALQSPMERNALLIYIALATPGNHIIVTHARNGVGKTSLYRQVAHALGVGDRRFKRWSMAHHSMEDLGGYPVPGDDGMRFVMPAGIKALNDGAPAVWLIDELGDAVRSMQAAAHQLLDERELGDDPVKASLKIVGAMNPPEYSTDAQEMGFGFANRCSFVPFESPDWNDFIGYRLRHGAPMPMSLPAISAEARAAAVAYVNTVASLYRGTPQAVLEEDPKAQDVTGRWPMAFATPRSWDCALNLAATCVALGDRGAMQMLMTGTIGEPQALAFCTFEQAQDLVPGLDAARDPSLFKPDAKRPDRTFAQVLAVAQAVCDPHFKGKEAADWWNAGWAFLEYCRALGPEPWSQVPPDMCLVGADYIARRQPSSRCLLAKHEGIIRELAPMVAASIVPEQQS